MLAGKGGKKLQRWGMDRMSTFGVLKKERVEWLVQLQRRLITAGYATISGDRYPVVHITKAGWQVHERGGARTGDATATIERRFGAAFAASERRFLFAKLEPFSRSPGCRPIRGPAHQAFGAGARARCSGLCRLQ